MSGVDESRFDYDYVPEHLKERVENYRGLSSQERMELTRDQRVVLADALTPPLQFRANLPRCPRIFIGVIEKHNVTPKKRRKTVGIL